MKRVELQLSELSRFPIVSPDTETTGIHWYRDKVFGIAVAAYDPREKIMASNYWDIRETPQVLTALSKELPKCKKIVNHNMKFDAQALMQEGVKVPLDRLECTSVRAALINENEGIAAGRNGFDLNSLCKKYLGREKEDIWPELAEMFGGKASKAIQIKNLHRAPIRLARKYAIVDPELAILLWEWQEKQIEEQNLHKIWNLERTLMPVIIKIERQGVRVDEDRARKAQGDIAKAVAEAQHLLDKIAGKEVNANSPVQMRALFGCKKEQNGDDVRWLTDAGFQLEITDGGEASLGKKSLIVMAELGDKRAEHVMTIRRMTKANSFLKDHILGHAVGGRVYPNYNQTRGDNELGTGPGRFSINDPALQQIPARDVDVARVVRSCFVPEQRNQWGCADWEQFEFRWFAHYTKDPNILRAYEEDPDVDFHQIVSEVTGIPRNPRYAGDANAKQINLGLVFGMGRGEMAYQMGLPYESHKDRGGREWKRAGPKANGIFDSYHSAIPGVQKLLDQAASIARSRGHVETVMGRHIRFPGGRGTHKAAGLVFQGTSADCMKQKMIELMPVCEENGWRMLLSVHDELDFDVPTKDVKRAKKILKEHLETFDGKRCPIYCRVPIRSEAKFGPNWFEASKKGD